MVKIAVISMVKNESDIIEHFVRHCLSFADIVLVMDHDSCDGTSEILSNLQGEDDRLVIEQCNTMGYTQSEVMTSLMKKAALEYGANIIIPLDADEFLVAYPGLDVCSAIRSLPKDTVCQLPLISHKLDNPALLSERFILNCPSKLLQEMGGAKVLITAGNWDWKNMILHQGNHFVSYRTYRECDKIEAKYQKLLYIAHFVRRSTEQQLSKYIVGWLHNVAEYSKYTPYAHEWGKIFRNVREGTYCETEIPVLHSYDKIQNKNQLIKYSYVAKVNPYRNLQITAEKMAQKVALNECLLAGNRADVIMLSCDDLQQCMASLSSVRAQKYAVDKVFIINSDDTYKYKDVLEKQFNELNLIFVSDISRVQEYSMANYIQMMILGDELKEDKIAASMTAIHQYADVGCIYFNGMADSYNTRDLILSDELNFSLISARELLNVLREDSRLPSGGIAGFLFKRHLLENINWFYGYELNDANLYWLGIFHMLSDCHSIVMVGEKAVKSIMNTDNMRLEYVMQLECI